jgi:hypothetical protein
MGKLLSPPFISVLKIVRADSIGAKRLDCGDSSPLSDRRGASEGQAAPKTPQSKRPATPLIVGHDVRSAGQNDSSPRRLLSKRRATAGRFSAFSLKFVCANFIWFCPN